MTNDALVPRPMAIDDAVRQKVRSRTERYEADRDPIKVRYGTSGKPSYAEDGPTPEWMRKHSQQFDAPQTDQSVRRAYYRRLSQLSQMYKKGQIEEAQFLAGERLYAILRNAAGIENNAPPTGAADLYKEEARVVAIKRVASAERAVGGSEWVCVRAVVEERFDVSFLEKIGKLILRFADRKSATGAAIQAVRSGLTRLEEHFADERQEKRRT